MENIEEKPQVYIKIQCDDDAVEKTLLELYNKVKTEKRLNFEYETYYVMVESHQE